MVISDQMVTSLAAAAFPTIAVLLGILINNQRLSDLARNLDIRFAETNRRIDGVDRRIEDAKDVLRAEMFRTGQVLDARLKHLEER